MTNEELTILEECRAKCREIELETFTADKDVSAEQKFRTKARMPWYEFCTRTMKSDDNVMHFREFWGNEDSYPRTIAIESKK